MAERILEMVSVTKSFPGVNALENVNLDAMAGEILAIVGQNGAGKSTLMKVLSGSYPYGTFQGKILLDGKERRFGSPAESEKAGIAMIYQEISTHLDLSVAENLYMGRWLRGGLGRIDWKKMTETARTRLEAVKLDVDPRQPVRTLNTSQQQLLCIAGALARDPRILVLDEPTSALTETESARLFEILHELKGKGIASILISHKLDEVFANADRITVLRDGKTVDTHLKANVDPGKIVSEMVGREMKDLYPKEHLPIGDELFRVENFTVPHPFNPKKNIVDGISFSLKKGEILGLAGLVGSGRSELVNAIFGKTEKKSGTVWLEGKKLDIKTPADSIAHGLALLTEDRKADGFVSVMTIRENTTLASLGAVSKFGTISRAAENRAAAGWFDKLAVKAKGMETRLLTLSGGNQQKVVLSKWLMTGPRVLILDEPTRGIDVGSKYEVYKIMTELVRQGISIIMISSELPELIAMSDRVLILGSGKIRGEIDACSCSSEMIMHLATGSTDIFKLTPACGAD